MIQQNPVLSEEGALISKAIGTDPNRSRISAIPIEATRSSPGYSNTGSALSCTDFS
ncbi:hypothetical protein [Arthrobacter ramosus]|uniref:Uncharacterized protein n=1 Tax=Arthrobacter ramosus TaxID=1672 RepID=A0ABV5Y677_ARTRM|nr:hypothetical protein [Arthrobacter ramosus]